MQPKSLPRYFNNRSSVERLCERLTALGKKPEDILAVTDPIVYLGGNFTEEHEKLITHQHGQGSEKKRRKLSYDEEARDQEQTFQKQRMYLYVQRDLEKGSKFTRFLIVLMETMPMMFEFRIGWHLLKLNITLLVKCSFDKRKGILFALKKD